MEKAIKYFLGWTIVIPLCAVAYIVGAMVSLGVLIKQAVPGAYGEGKELFK